MKKRLIIASVIVVLLFLVARAIYIRIGKARNERIQYVKSLGFHFSAEVDSLRTFSGANGWVYFHVTSGELNLSMEERANQKSKFNGSLRFILPEDGKLAIHSRDLDKYQLDDSLVINADVDKIYIYRQGKLTAESEIWKALNGI